MLLPFSREEPDDEEEEEDLLSQEELFCECKQVPFFSQFLRCLFRKSFCETKTRISTTGHTAWLALGGVSPPWVESVVEELLQTVGGLEDLGDLAVQLANHLVDGLLPRRVCVLSSHDGVEELSKGDLGHLQEAIRNLGGRGRAERAEVVNGNQYFSSEKANLPQTPCLDWKTSWDLN